MAAAVPVVAQVVAGEGVAVLTGAVPMPLVLVNDSGEPINLSGVSARATHVVPVAAPDALQAAGDAVAKEEFDAIVTLANATKACLNEIVEALIVAGLMAAGEE